VNQLPFIAAAYAITFVAVAGLFGWSFAAMRRAERDAEAVRRER
jgi:heme exporter protein CcmD